LYHPSGVAEPSDADWLITRRIRDALDLVDIRLLDHFVVGDGVCESLAARGLIQGGTYLSLVCGRDSRDFTDALNVRSSLIPVVAWSDTLEGSYAN
jgi:hypothetical protein